jgi:hypothetical protein
MLSRSTTTTQVIRTFGILLFMWGALSGLKAKAAPVWDGSITQEDGWTVMNNPASPMEGDTVIQPEPLWRLGGEDEDVLFGLVEDAVVDEQGNSYLLDTILSTVLVVSRDGEILRNVSGEGDGPGEFRFARELVFLPDGALGIMEMMPGKIVSVDTDGTPRPSFAIDSTDGGGMMNHLQHIAANRRGVLIGRVTTNFDENGATIHRLLSLHGTDGAQKAVIREDRETQSGGNIQLGGKEGDEFTANFTLTDDGRVVTYPDSRKYELRVYGEDGSPRQLIRRQYESVRRPEEELAAARKQAEEMRERFNGSVEIEVPEMADDIAGVIARPDGELWVANSRGNRESGENSIGWFDVFNAEGQYTRRLLIKADYDPSRDAYTVFGDRLFIFKEAQNAPPRSQTMGGGGTQMVMMVSSGSVAEEEDEDEDPRPFEVICYMLPD